MYRIVKIIWSRRMELEYLNEEEEVRIKSRGSIRYCFEVMFTL
jgi:hypothetical protein